MFHYFSDQKYDFPFNQRTFEIFDDHLISELLGRSGNQTAINTAGSAWKKIIHRYPNDRQEESVYPNPKYIELKNFLHDHLSHESDLLNYLDNFQEINIDNLIQSSSPSDKQLISKFTRFREILTTNLNLFKTDSNFRISTTNKIYDGNHEFMRNIPVEYAYILLCLYIAHNYSYFKNNQERILSKWFRSENDYHEKYHGALFDPSFHSINNLTCFCYTQYFWFDYRLSDSLDSAIHSILFDMFGELEITPTTELTLQELFEEHEIKTVVEPEEDSEFHYPDIGEIEVEYVNLTPIPQVITTSGQTGSGQRIPKVIDFESEHRKNKRLGDQGELIVYFDEIKELQNNGRSDLSNRVKIISREDDSAGFDILSFDLDGRERPIEVKSTNSKPKKFSFFMSANEYRLSQELENYYIYIVFEAKTNNPKIWKIENPMRYEGSGIDLIPSKYRVIVNIE
jgi:hypothetical protein